MDFHTLSRRQLQALCKKNKIPANQTNVAMAAALAALPTVEGLEELSPAKGGASVAATTTRRTSRVKDAGVLQNGKTPAKVKTLDFTEEVEVIYLDTPAPVPAGRRRGATTKGGETALSTRRSTRLAAKSTPRGSETAAPKKMEFEEIAESFGGISLDEKSEQVGESDLSAEKQEVSEVVEPEMIVDSNVPKDGDETKIDELVTVAVDAADENNAVDNGGISDMSEEEVEAKNGEVLDGTDEQVIGEKEIQSSELVEMKKSNVEAVADVDANEFENDVEEVMEPKQDAEAKNDEALDGTDEQVIDEKEIQSSENVEMKESNVEAMADVDANEFENDVEEVMETKQDAVMDASQTEAKNDEVLDGTDEQVIVEKETQSSENVEMKESNVEAMDDVDANEFEKDVGQLDIDVNVVSQIETNSKVDCGTDEQVIDEGKDVENEGSCVVDDMSDADESEAQSSDFESEDESEEESDSESDDLTESGGSEDDSIAETVVEPELVNSDDLTESVDSEDDSISETAVEPELVIALGVPSAAAEVLEDSLAEKLDSIELKDGVVEEDNVMEDSKVLEMEAATATPAMSYLSPVKAPVSESPTKIPQLQMSVRKTPTSGKRMTVRFSDDDKENSMIGSIGAKLMMLASPTKERSEKKESLVFKESQKPYKAEELSLRKLKKELKAKLSETGNNDKNKVGGARQALQALPENRQVMESN